MVGIQDRGDHSEKITRVGGAPDLQKSCRVEIRICKYGRGRISDLYQHFQKVKMQCTVKPVNSDTSEQGSSPE